MKKIIYIIIALIIIAGGYYFYDRNKKQVKAPEIQNQPMPTEAALPTATPSPKATPAPKSSTNAQGGTFSSGEDAGDGSSVQVYAVEYDGSKFIPASIEISQNDWIFFKNNGTKDFWPAAGPHPSHSSYPEFDPKAPVAPGKTFKFQFTKVGNWNYHDHLNESATGVINVK